MMDKKKDLPEIDIPFSIRRTSELYLNSSNDQIIRVQDMLQFLVEIYNEERYYDLFPSDEEFILFMLDDAKKILLTHDDWKWNDAEKALFISKLKGEAKRKIKNTINILLNFLKKVRRKYKILIKEFPEESINIDNLFQQLEQEIECKFSHDHLAKRQEQIQRLEEYLISLFSDFVMDKHLDLEDFLQKNPSYLQDKIIQNNLDNLCSVQIDSIALENESIQRIWQRIKEIDYSLSIAKNSTKSKCDATKVAEQEQARIQSFLHLKSVTEFIIANSICLDDLVTYKTFSEFLTRFKKNVFELLKQKIKILLNIKNPNKDRIILNLIEQNVIITEDNLYIPEIQQLLSIVEQEIYSSSERDITSEIDNLFDSENVTVFQNTLIQLAQRYLFTITPIDFCKKIKSRSHKYKSDEPLQEIYRKYIYILNEAVRIFSDKPSKNVFFPIINHNILSSLKGKYPDEISSSLLHIIKVNENMNDKTRYPMQVYKCMTETKIPSGFRKIALEAHSGRYEISKDGIRFAVDQLEDGTYYIRSRVEHSKNDSVQAVYKSVNVIKQQIDCSYENQIYIINECLSLISKTKGALNSTNSEFIIYSIMRSLISLQNAIEIDETLSEEDREVLLDEIDRIYNETPSLNEENVTFRAITTAKKLLM